MAQVSGNPSERRRYPGKANRVIHGGEIRWYAVEFTNSEALADVALAAVFGKDAKDGLPHVAIIEPHKLKDLLTEPHPFIRDGVRALHGVQNAPPADLPMGDLGDGAGLELEGGASP